MKEKILRMTLLTKWFREILSERKKEEYREIKPYWTLRLFHLNGEDKKYDYILFRNGYNKNAPEMKVEYKGVKLGKFEGKEVYTIQLGKIIETKNTEKFKLNH